MPSVKGPKKRKRTGLIIFLVLLGIAILIGGILLAQWFIWNKVKDTIEGGRNQLELAEECRNIELQEQVSELSNGQYKVTLTNILGNKNVKVKLKLLNTLTDFQSGLLDFGDTLAPSETKTNTFDTTVVGANKIEVTPYIVELEGEIMCPTAVSNI